MQLRTYFGFLAALVIVVFVAFESTLNREILAERFHLTASASIPLYLALLLVFLAGFLPPVTILLVQSLQRDLVVRRQRRLHREAESLDNRARRAEDYRVDGLWKKAAAELEVVLSAKPEDFATLLRYGEVMRCMGRTEEALDAHRKASALYPRSIAVLYQLAKDYEARGEHEVAREIRNRVVRDFSDQGLQVMRRRRDHALLERDWPQAQEWQERMVAAVGEGAAEAAEAAGGGREAAIAQGLRYQRGVALLEEDRATEAAELFRQQLSEDPRFVPAGIMLGEAELLAGREREALAEWSRGFERTGSPIFLQRLEDYFIEAGEPGQGLEMLRSMIAAAEKDLLPRFFLGRLYYRLEMHEEALKTLEAVRDDLDASPSYHYLIGRIHQRRDAPRRAVAAFEVCLQRLGVTAADYVCGRCSARYPDWQDRCQRCGRWSSVELDIREEELSVEELGLVERPVWGGYGGLAEPEPSETAAES